MTSIAHLPVDILLLISPYLTPSELLALCSTCKNLRNDEILYSPAYWSNLAHITFRVPNQRAAADDGRRWMDLYRRMKTQSRVYLWGKNDKGALGGSSHHTAARSRIRGHLHPGRTAHTLQPGRVNWPSPAFFQDDSPADAEIDGEAEETGQNRFGHIISDLQSGGYSTVLLTAEGYVYAQGALNGLRDDHSVSRLTELFKLEFPPEMRNSGLSPQITIRQMSVGRGHVLGLSDSGKLWSWSEKHKHALGVKFATIDLIETPSRSTKTPGNVRQVVAGWSKSSAYVYGKGIVTWEPIDNAQANDQSLEGVDTILELNQWVVPNTGQLEGDDQVATWIVLENYIVYTTLGGKAYGVKLPTDDDPITQPFQLTVFPKDVSSKAPYDRLVDCQGSFRQFALLFKSDAVLIGNQDYLEMLHRAHAPSTEDQSPDFRAVPKLKSIPALQNSSVVQLAFGDYHFHALHASGRITSYGREPDACGALGLGVQRVRTFRGAVYVRFMGSDCEPLAETLTSGRSVAFSDAIKDWLETVFTQRHDEESRERLEFTETESHQGDLAVASEWLEQQIREVESSEVLDYTDDDDGLPAYFTLSVAAAGHHSGALVLVNDKKAAAVAEAATAKKGKGFPRLTKVDGTPMPGTVDVEQWQCPTWQPIQVVEI